MTQAPLPLSRYTVIDLTRARAGPTAARQMADWGANVIKVEEPGDNDGDGSPFDRRHGSDFQNLQRNKRSITLNLKSQEGLAVFRRLVEKADVLIENYRPGVKDRLGIDYPSLSKLNPRLVYASISGFGQSGPYRDRPGLDPVVQGMGGLMSITGMPEQGPVRTGIAISDSSSGLYCTIGILMALLEREASGKGQWVHTSLLQALIAMLDFQAARWLMDRDVPGQAGNHHPTGSPSGVFPTSDGAITIIATGHLFDRLCKAIDAPALLADPDFADSNLRARNRDRLNALIGERTRTRTSEAWIAALNAAGVPSSPIYRIDQMFADPQVQALAMDRAVSHPKLGEIHLVGQGVNMERTPWSMRRAAPDRGEDTDAILSEIGYSPEEVAALRSRGAV